MRNYRIYSKYIRLCFLLLIFCCFSIKAIAQSDWDITRNSFTIQNASELYKTNVSSNSITLANNNYRQKKNYTLKSCNGKIVINEYTGSNKRIIFNVQNINKKVGVYWGFGIDYISHGTKYYIDYTYGIASTGGIGLMKTLRRVRTYKYDSHNEKKLIVDSGWNEYYGDNLVGEIKLICKEYRTVDIHDGIDIKSAREVTLIKDIHFKLYEEAKIRIYNFKIEAESMYSKVKVYITNGDNLFNNGNYKQAVLEYSKAIDAGYKKYDMYIKRAKTFIGMEYYNNAIEDLTSAISLNATTSAYLLRGKVKLQKQDTSCIDDFKRGGTEGQMILKELGIDPNAPLPPSPEYKSSGSGIILTTNGVIITNYHVVENAQKIDVFVSRNNGTKKYKAKVLISDKQNDLTLLKIDDDTFTNLPALPYAVKTPILDVGTSVFALGYPMSSTLGEELKVTDGIISSKTGYQGDIVTYQISAPIQPGNSGGPLFDKQGYLVGITNAGVPDAQNVGYAIKASYLRNLVDVSPVPFVLPSNNTISGLSFTEKIKKISPYVVLIKVK